MTKEDFKAQRLHNGWSQSKMQEILGYQSVSSIAYKESGKNPVTKQDEIILSQYPKPEAETSPVK